MNTEQLEVVAKEYGNRHTQNVGMYFGQAAQHSRASLGRLQLLAVVLTVLGLSSLSLAQTLPSTTDPGRLRERFESQPQPGRAPEPTTDKRERAEAMPDSFKSLRLTLKTIRIEGATVVPVSRLQAQADTYTGREVTGSEILELLSSLTAIYRNAGYILSLVIVPPQTISDGTLTLSVIEGYIDRVNIQAGEGVDASLRERLTEIGENIRASRPIQAAVLERYLLIANSENSRVIPAGNSLAGNAEPDEWAGIQMAEASGLTGLGQTPTSVSGPGAAGSFIDSGQAVELDLSPRNERKKK